MNRRIESLGLALLVLFIIGGLAFQLWPSGDGSGTSVSAGDREQTSALLEEADRSAPASTDIVYDRTIAVEDLPPEAIDTLILIDDDGPYPYRKDGSTFQNREGRLPDHRQGHYREFTVETPGSSDRGARRIVAGDDGELYWTADHYDSFAQIVGW